MGNKEQQWLGEEAQYIAFRDECHAVIDELRATVATQTAEIERLRNENASLRLEIRTQRKEIAGLREERRSLFDADKAPGSDVQRGDPLPAPPNGGEVGE